MAKAKTKQSTPASVSKKLGGQLVLGALIAELLGSAIVAFAALMGGNSWILVAFAVLVGVLIFGELSGGHLNPVVTVSLWATKQIGWIKALGYLVVQFIGAMLAYVVVAKFMKSSDPTAPSTMYTLFTNPNDQSAQSLQTAPRNPGEWKPIFGELAGAVIFGFGVASAFLGKKVGFERAFTIGGALMVGLVTALAGSYAVLNPAVAVSLSGFARGGFWSIAAYGLAPLVGGVAGAWLYKLLQRDVATAASK